MDIFLYYGEEKLFLYNDGRYRLCFKEGVFSYGKEFEMFIKEWESKYL